jgi:hypothetical protein
MSTFLLIYVQGLAGFAGVAIRVTFILGWSAVIARTPIGWMGEILLDCGRRCNVTRGRVHVSAFALVALSV